MSETRSKRVNFQTTPALFRRLRRLAFLHGWTLSRAGHEALGRGLSLLEAELTQEDREAWQQLLGDLQESLSA
jgi:hypothetical protein